MSGQAQSGPPAGDEGARSHAPHAHAVEDVAGFELDEGVPEPSFRARWQLFLPTLAIALIYSVAWLYLMNTDKGHYALTRLVVIVMAVGVPLLAVHAFLRYQTIRVQVLPDTVRYHSGWPRDLPIDMPLELIDRVRVKRGLSGMLFGGGTLIMDLATGEKAAIADLNDPGGARAAIEQRMPGDAGEAPPAGAFEF
ncbi:MAG: PH domain-containing protein [Pseudomonadota bacterium]|nr:PH domain-containing protein [Pseudomonadota bacterium]